MIIDPDGDVVPDRIRGAAADQEIGFRILDGDALRGQRLEKFLQLGIQGSQLEGIRRLRPSEA